MQNLVDILKLAELEAEPMGLVVVETRLSQQGKRRVLEISICRKGAPISLSDCEELSRKLDRALDQQVPPLIDGSYLLEVQSPGSDRQLKNQREFEIFSGEVVEVKTKEPVAALGDHFTGTLHTMADGVLTINNPQPIETNVKHRKKGKASQSMPALPEKVCLESRQVIQVRLHPCPSANQVPGKENNQPQTTTTE